MKRSVILAIGLLCLSSVRAGFAETGYGISAYLGDLRGSYEYPGLEDVDGKATATGLAARLDMNANASLELGFQDMSSFGQDLRGPTFPVPVASDDIETSFYHLSLIGRLPLNDSVSLRARVGLAKWDVEETFQAGSLSGKDDDSGSDPFYGIGFGARFSDAVSGSIEYQTLEFSPKLFLASTDVSYRTILLGLQFRF